MAGAEVELSQKGKRTACPPISYLLAAAVQNPDLISLAAGFVDDQTLPTEAVRRLLGELLGDRRAGRQALQYGTTEGLEGLRAKLVGHLAALEGCRPEDLGLSSRNCIVTSGSQQGLYLLADVLVDPGDIVITSAPSYFVYTDALGSVGARVTTVPMDSDGMRVDLLEALLETMAGDGRIDRLRAIYCVSYFQNPTGLSLSRERRARLVELARRYSRRHRIVVIEDAAYRALRYEGPDLPSIKSFDRENRYVVYAMTFSKAFAPGLKTGALIVPDELVEPILNQKGNHDFGSGNLAQHLICRAMTDGSYHRQVQRLRQAYLPKRDAMLEALDEYLGALEIEGAQWTRPQGGLYVWLTLPVGWDTRMEGELFRKCLERGVIYVPGNYCFVAQPEQPVPVNAMRLSFGVAGTDAIRRGIAHLAAAIRESGGRPTPVGTSGAAGR